MTACWECNVHARLHPQCVAELTGRIIYALGYGSGDPNKRLPGAIIANLTQMVTLAALAYTAFKVLTGRPI